jgi:hypothetical protein
MALPGNVPGVSGGLIMASALPRHTLVRRRLDRNYPYLRRRLFDPQLFLAGLNAVVARKACSNLSSYGWFPVSSGEEYSSSVQRQADWNRRTRAEIHREWIGSVPQTPSEIENAIRMALDLQMSIGCEALILPSPLTVDLATDYSLEISWLDQGLWMASEMFPGVARLPTVALSDSCLRVQDAQSNQLLDLILDQLTSRAPEGVYLVLETANESGYYITHPNTIGSMLRLIHGLKEGGIRYVVVGFAGVAGILALAVGASAWSTGWYRGERRLKIVDFDDQTGMAVPTFYSHKLASEIHLERDVDSITRAGLLELVSDETSASAGLLRALRSGYPAASVVEWQYRRSNVGATREHFLNAMVRETTVMSRLRLEERVSMTRQWLSEADRLASTLLAMGPFNGRTELRHQAAWAQAFERFLQQA